MRVYENSLDLTEVVGSQSLMEWSAVVYFPLVDFHSDTLSLNNCQFLSEHFLRICSNCYCLIGSFFSKKITKQLYSAHFDLLLVWVVRHLSLLFYRGVTKVIGDLKKYLGIERLPLLLCQAQIITKKAQDDTKRNYIVTSEWQVIFIAITIYSHPHLVQSIISRVNN